MPRAEPPAPRVSVLMPTFKQAAFLPRALESLLAQTLTDWELIVLDDGSPDETADVLAPYLADPRVRLIRFERNRGLGHALNVATREARGRYLAYLPSDDVYYPDHLGTLADLLDARPEVDLAYGGVRWAYWNYGPTLRGEEAVGREAEVIASPPAAKRGERVPSGNPLALVQVMHRRQDAVRWVPREEEVSDRLELNFWRGLLDHGARFAYAGTLTCEWVDHPDQRHKIIAGFVGGLSRYRAHYGVGEDVWLNFQPSRGMRTDERERYGPFAAPRPRPARDGLHVLLVGSLGFNPERITALEALGHRLSALWLPKTETWDSAGPFPFGHIETLPLSDAWRERVRAARPDVIYALLNWQDLAFIHQILSDLPDIPAVFHFKEGPFICLEHGLWPTLVEVLERADGHVFISPENRDWFRLATGGRLADKPTLLLDGDLPSRVWMTDEWAPKLSGRDGQIHTVCAGRPIGLVPWEEIAAAGIHVHFYGAQFHEWFPNWSREGLETGHMHLHPTVTPAGWVRELSRYDAGWVQIFDSRNGGDLRRANWDDLNLPARLGTYAAAGLPWIMRDNRHSLVAMQTLAQRHDFGLFFRDFADAAAQLRDRPRLAQLTANARAAREDFAFETHAPALIALFRQVILRRQQDAGVPLPSD